MTESPLPQHLAELLDKLTETTGLITREVRTMQVMPAAAANNDDVPQTEGKLTELFQQIEKAKSDLAIAEAKRDNAVEDMEHWENAVGAASRQHYELTSHITTAKTELQRINDELSKSALDRSRSEQIIAQAAQANAQLEQRTQSINAREQAVAAQELSITQRSEHIESTRYWLEQLLPVWLNEGSILDWHNALMDDAQHPRAASNAAGLLFATLSLYTYALRDSDTRAIADALRDVGRRLFSWLKERELGDYEASTVAQAWADHINRECSGRCEIEVPVPGTPAQNQIMLYQPRPGVSAQSVIAVQSWCVRGAKREVIHRAAITV
ncbi:MAG: hypothetical protein WCN98_05215 [Verrucomicrobiaceae bacterium]